MSPPDDLFERTFDSIEAAESEPALELVRAMVHREFPADEQRTFLEAMIDAKRRSLAGRDPENTPRDDEPA